MSLINAPCQLLGWTAFVTLFLSAGAIMGELSEEDLEARLQYRIEQLAAMDSRVTGYPGAFAAAQFLTEYLENLGLREVHARRFHTPVPLDQGASLRFPGVPGSSAYALQHMWPNLVRTSTVPPPGIAGPLVYAGSGNPSELDGSPMRGAIAVFEYDCGRRWVRAFDLGAEAVIFLAPSDPGPGHRWESSQKYLTTPADLPRFYAPEAASGKLRNVLSDTRSPAQPVRAVISGSMVWRNAPARTVVAVIPGIDPGLRREAVVVGSYYDAISAVPALAPGADQASGAAAWMELAGALAAHPPRRTAVLVATAGHFQALAGMRDFIGFLRSCGRAGEESSPSSDAGSQDRQLRSLLCGLEIACYIGLDLSSRSRQLALVQAGPPYRVRRIPPSIYDPITSFTETYEERNLQGEMILGGALKPLRRRRLLGALPERVPVSGAVASLSGMLGMTLVSAADERARFDSPGDLPGMLEYPGLAAQTRFIVALIQHLIDADIDMSPEGGSDSFGRLEGRVVRWGPQSYQPDEPVEGALVRARTFGKTTMGVHADPLAMTGKDGRFTLTGLEARTLYLKAAQLEAYQMDPASGRVISALDRGPLGTGKYPAEVLMDDVEKECTLVTFPCAGVTLFDLVDPRRLAVLDHVRILESGKEAEPASFGYCLPPTASQVARDGYHHLVGPDTESTAVLFVPPGTDLKAILSGGRFGLGRRGLLLNGSPDAATGSGYSAFASRLPATALHLARDTHGLNRERLEQLESHGIASSLLSDLNDAAEEALGRAASACQEGRNTACTGESRRAWALASQAYGATQSLSAGAVQGVVFVLFLLIPFAVLGERLLLASRGIRGQVAGSVALFAAAFAVLRFSHPSFELSLYPSLILLGFAILSLSLAVIGLGITRLNAQLRLAGSPASALHRAGSARGGILWRSFALGVAQMRRRPWRTALTASTLVLLTCTLASFTSVRAGHRFNRTPVSDHLPGGTVPPALMLRMPEFAAIEAAVIDHLALRFSSGKVVARRWYLKPVQVRGRNGSSRVEAVAGVSAFENLVNPIDDALLSGRWMAAGETACVLPANQADLLGVQAGNLGTATVRVFGADYPVVGIVDPERYDQLRDISGDPLTPLDVEVHQPDEQRVGIDRGGLQPAFVHLSSSQVLFLSGDAVARWGEWSRVASIAVLFENQAAARRDIDEMALTSELNLFARLDDGTFRINTVGVRVFSGRRGVWIPLLIAALIAFNTMLGSVYERLPEIGTLNAVGLAPGHVAGLFLAEAGAFCLLSAVLGSLLGFAIAQAGTFHLLPGLTVNYSSLSAVATVAVVMAVVLASAGYPALMASRICTPGIERSWTLPRPRGDLLMLSLPFSLNRKEAHGFARFLREYLGAFDDQSTGALFYAEDVAEKSAGVIDARVWLAPFDQGVSQTVRLVLAPDVDHRFFTLETTIERLSGNETTWWRANRIFVDSIRKQFLVWRNLPAEHRGAYLEPAT